MKTPVKLTLAMMAWLGSLLGTAAQPTAFTYQGRLADPAGNPVSDGYYDFRFTIHHDAVLPDVVTGPVSDLAVPVTNGLFTARVDLGIAAYTSFQEPSRWLAVEVSTNAVGAFSAVNPRVKLLSVPYALFANSASNLLGNLPASQLTGTLPAGVLTGADGGGLTNLNASELDTGWVPDDRLSPNVARTNQVWLLGGNGGTLAGPQFLGTTDAQPLELKVSGARVARFEPTGDSDDPGTVPDGAPNVIAGASQNAVTPGVVGATISGGGAANYGGLLSQVNLIASHYASIGGGQANRVGSNSSFSAIGGGRGNVVEGIGHPHGAVVAGGSWNSILWSSAAGSIGGGQYNVLSNAPNATVAGGAVNLVEAQEGTVGGGGGNRIGASASHAVIVGGYGNTIRTNSESASIGGGFYNEIGGAAAGGTIGGGRTNIIERAAAAATIGGGVFNTIQSQAAYGTIGGGLGNLIPSNSVYATVAGGRSNTAVSYSFAAGHTAKAIHPGSFVWCDAMGGEFPTAASNQFLIRAAGGVCIGGNNPQAHLAVVGPGTNPIVRLYQTEDKQAALTLGTSFQTWRIGQNRPPDDTTKADGFFIHDDDANQTRLYINTSGNVGIGTNTPVARLDVNGTSLLRSNVTVGDAATVSFGSNKRQIVNLYSTNYGVGVQDNTLYFRSNKRFSWFADGTHNNAENNPGTGGTALMTLKDDLMVVNGGMMTLTLSGLTVNGTFVSTSDRNAKEDFKPVDTQAVLDKVLDLPLSEWTYKCDPERSRHFGPMAQDFKAAFDLGTDDKHIATVDADGVALAAIQGLNQKLAERETALRRELDQKQTEITDLKARLEKLEHHLNSRP